jgi:hypothetical protein
MIRKNNVVKIFGGEMELPAADNTAKALQVYRAANERFRRGKKKPSLSDINLHQLSLFSSHNEQSTR